MHIMSISLKCLHPGCSVQGGFGGLEGMNEFMEAELKELPVDSGWMRGGADAWGLVEDLLEGSVTLGAGAYIYVAGGAYVVMCHTSQA